MRTLKLIDDLKNKFKWISTEQVAYRNKQAGMKWFDKGAMKFFNTVPCEYCFYNRHSVGYFVTGDRENMDLPQRFTVRRVDDLGGICAVWSMSEFQEFLTADEAYDYIYRLLEEQDEEN